MIRHFIRKRTTGGHSHSDNKAICGIPSTKISTGNISMKSHLLNPLAWFIVALSLAAGCGGGIASAAEGAAASSQKVSVSNPEVSRKLAAEGLQLIADYGSYQLWAVPAAIAASVAAEQGVTVVEGEDMIELSAGPINTAGLPPSPGPAVASADFSGKRLHLVQFAGAIKPDWHASLVKAGLQVVAYVPRNAYLVYGESAALSQFRLAAADAPHVQWESAYLPEHKIHPRARAAAEKAIRQEVTDDLFAVQLVEDESANAQSLQFLDQIRRELIRRSAFLGYVNVILRLPPERLAEVAALPDVVSIQTYELPRKRDERQGQILAGNLTGGLPNGPGYLAWLASKGFTADQFAASGFGVDVSDSGIDNGTTSPNHPNLHVLGDPAQPGRVLYNRLVGTPNPGSTLQGCDGHGNLNSHIIAGYNDLSGFPHTDSLGYHYGLGIAPFVRVGSSVIFDPDYFTSPDYAQLQSRAYHDGARISCNSWGASAAGAYNIDSQAYDALVRDAQPSGSPFPTAGNQEMVIIFSAGNAGSGANSIGSPGTGKNIISVGAAENVHSHSTANGGNDSTGNDGCAIPDTGADNANDIIFFSSRGPCVDGRIKPDIMGPGTHVTGGVGQQAGYGSLGTALACFAASGVCALPGGGTVGSPNDFFPLGQQFYTTSSGTSHSCPALGGGAALLRQYFINQTWPAPSPAMTKAWLMNASRYMTGLSANDTLPSNNQGMGMMNLGTAFDGVLRIHRDQLEEDRFTASGQVRAFQGFITDPTKPLRVTLAWTDAPGSTVGNAYNNNLDLTVTLGGQTYRGNVFSGAFSIPGGTNDPRNNVESVFLPAGLTGQYTINVTAANVNSDGVPGNADPLDQDFALVVYNSTDRPVLPVPAGATVTAESCAPGQGAIDPGETVTVEFGLRNLGPSNSVALVATLLATDGVVASSGPQSYGVLVSGGASASRPFTFSASGRCGGSLTAVLHLQDGTNDYGVVSFPFTLGLMVTNTSSSTHGTPITISATDGTVAPYPSPITINGLSGAISKLTVMLNGLSHTWPDDLDVLLVGSQGQSVMLLSDAGGGYSATNLTLTFDDGAAAKLPAAGPLTSGVWRPSNFGLGTSLPAPAPVAPYGAALSDFMGSNPNGIWQLFVADDYSSDDGGLIAGGWSLTFVITNSACCLDPATADLALGIRASPELVAISSNITYTINVTNLGPAIATGVLVTNLLPPQAAFVSATASQGTAVNFGGAVSWNLGSLASGAVASAQIVANVQGGPTLVDQAKVICSQSDFNPLNNQATVTTAVNVPLLSVEDVSIVEGDTGSRPAVFIVTLSRASPLRVDVDYATVPGTATPGVDYLPMTNTLHFFPGDVAQTIEVPVIGDVLNEESETFSVVLSNPINANLSRAQATATIIDDDPMPAVSVGDIAVLEGQGGTTNAVFPITLSQPSGRLVSVTCTTSNGTAQASSDFTALTRTLTFAPGQTATNFTVSVSGDTINEPDETFLVQLSSPVNAVLGRATGVGTILTDDIGPSVSVVSCRLTAESQSPPNGIIDAGETVTLSVAFRNDGSANTANLIATLMPGNGVVGPSGPQTYGALVAGGSQVSRPFTFTVGSSNCSTLSAVFQLQDGSANLGSQTLQIIVGGCFADDFEPGIDLAQWAAFGGTVGSTVLATNYGGSVSPSHSLWFGDDGSRFARTRPLDTSCGGTVSFYLHLANGLAWPWEYVDLPGEGVVLEYSTDSGSTWTTMGTYDTTSYYDWTPVSLLIPAGAQAAATQFQWRQLSHSGSCCDHWALDDVLILTGPTPAKVMAQPASQTVRPGTNVTLCVTAAGCRPISYQWCKDGTPLVEDRRISGTASACLSISNAVEADTGQYSVTVSNVYGGQISSNAALIVTLLDHFAWGNIASPQTSSVPFRATIIAQDAANSRVTNYNGCVTLSRGGGATNIVGTGTTAVTYPLGTFYHDERTQIIYQPSEIAAAGRITALALYVTTLPGQLMNNWTIRMKHTALSAYTSYLWESSGWTIVYQTNLSVTASGWVTFQLTTPFDYDGVSNLMIDFSFNNSSYTSNGYCRATARTGIRTLYYQTDSGYGDPLTWTGSTPSPLTTSYTPNLRLVFGGLPGGIDPTLVCLSDGGWTGDITVLQPATNMSLVATDVAGHRGTSTIFNVLPPVPSLCNALDECRLTWTTGGNGSWFPQTTNTHDGLDAAQSGVIGNSQQTWVATTVIGPGTLTFWWQVSSESCCDPLTFYVDAAAQADIRGLVNWQQRTFSIAAGAHTLRWTYSKDVSAAGGLDAGWLDQVAFVPDNPAPTIVSQPASQTVRPGSNVTFCVTASGTLPLYYQWRKDGTNLDNSGRIAGALNGCLTISNAVESDGGQYSVALTNDSGWAISSNATLLVSALDHLAWSSIGSPQLVGTPFPVTITARDEFGGVVSNFTGTVVLSGYAGGGGATGTLLNGLAHTDLDTSIDLTLAVAFTPNTNLQVTHLRYYSGTKVSLWTDAGVLLASQSVVGTPGTWAETQLAIPIPLTAGTRYRVGAYYPPGTNFYYRANVPATFTNGTIDFACYSDSGDAFPSNDLGTDSLYLVDLRYSVGFSVAVAVSPTNSGAFADGGWTGYVTVLQPATNTYLVATHSAGPRGTSISFDVLPARPVILAPVLVNGGFYFSFTTITGRTYVVEYKHALTNGAWIPLQTNVGDGTLLTVTNSVTASPQQFFRVRTQ
jgi:uncharacterized repeat protein (TIGR01451 family)